MHVAIVWNECIAVLLPKRYSNFGWRVSSSRSMVKWKGLCLLYYYYNCFMALCLGLPGWANTRRNIHPLTSILVINHHPSTTIHSILPVQFTCLAVFAQSLFKSSLLYLLVWHPPLHTPYVSSSNYFLLFTTPANAIATCFAVVLRLCHLILDRRCWDWLCHALVPRRSDILLSLRL